MGHMKLEDLLLSLKLGQTATPPDEKLSEAVAIPLAVAFSFFVLLSLSAICLSISGLRDAQQDLKRISNPHGTMQEENRRRVNTWWRIAKHFKTKPEEVKKPQLPTYAYAVRQAVLKRGTRQGDPQEEFHRISMEEMELERIAKLGGAPPCEYIVSLIRLR